MNLRRFWFIFRNPPPLSPLGLGCGITALSREEAIEILAETVFAGQTFPAIDRVIEDVDVRTLDPLHVVPNMGQVANRGVWFPLGY